MWGEAQQNAERYVAVGVYRSVPPTLPHPPPKKKHLPRRPHGQKTKDCVPLLLLGVPFSKKKDSVRYRAFIAAAPPTPRVFLKRREVVVVVKGEISKRLVPKNWPPPTAHYWALCTTSGPNTEMKDEKRKEGGGALGEELITASAAADDDDDRGGVGGVAAGDCRQ